MAQLLIPTSSDIIPDATGLGSKVIVGYYASWKCYSCDEPKRDPFLPTDIEVQYLTHIIYAFAKINDDLIIDHADEWADCQKVFELPGPNRTLQSYQGLFQILNSRSSPLRSSNPLLQVLIGIGGWTESHKFSEAVATEVSRYRLAASIVDFVIQHGFDGADIDWEYPCVKGHEKNKVSPDDGVNFTHFLRVLRQLLAQTAIHQRRPRPYLLTVATSAGSWSYSHIQLDKLADLVDWCNIMCYDAAGEWSQGIGHHAPLIPLITNAVQDYLNLGMPAYRICIGIPLYGRAFANVEQARIGASFDSVPGDGTVDFDCLQKDWLGYERHCDESAGGAISLWHSSHRIWVSADTAASVANKVDWIQQRNLRGVFFWELSMDRNAAIIGEASRRFNMGLLN